MSLLTKALMLLGVGLICNLQLTSQTVTIIESQSSHPQQDMDARWQDKSQEMGFASQIVNYSFLDQTCLIDHSDIIIVSSAIIDVNSVQVDNLKTFVESGGSLYIQGEYLGTYPGNTSFTDLVNHFGDSFSWGSPESNDIGPLDVNNPLDNNYNSVNSLEYFWYGISGTGTGAFTPILSKNGKDYGFIYNPTASYAGKVTTITDQDWIRLDYGELLLENFISSFPLPDPVMPTVFASTNDQNFCAGSNVLFETQITGNDQNLNFQWMVNGVDLNGETNSNLNINSLVDGDVVECLIDLTYGCKTYQHISNPILMSPIFPLNTSSINIEIIQSDNCDSGTNQFSLNILNPDGIPISAVEWSLNNTVLNNSNTNILTINDLNTGDKLSVSYSVVDPCYGLIWIEEASIDVILNTEITPTVEMINSATQFCEGESTLFEITGEYWGSNPVIEWYLDGNLVASGSETFSPASLDAGFYFLQAFITSSEVCVTQQNVSTPAIQIEVSPAQQLEAFLSSDKTLFCEGETATFTIDDTNLGNQAIIEWYIDGQLISNQGLEFQSNSLVDGSIISVAISTDEACFAQSSIVLDPISVSVSENKTPYIIIESDDLKVCPGAELNLQASGDFWGENPSFDWYVNGNSIPGTLPTLALTAEEGMTNVMVRLQSDYACLTTDQAESEQVSLEALSMQIAINTISNEHCDQNDGQILLDVNGGFGQISGLWNINQTGFEASNLSEGIYSFEAVDSLGCTTKKDLEILNEAGPAINSLGIIQPDCVQRNFGETHLILENGSSDVSIYWMNENLEEIALGPNAQNLTPGLYSVEVVDDYGCVTEDQFEIQESHPIFLTGDEEIEIGLGENLVLDPHVISDDENLSFSWTGSNEIPCFDCESLSITPTESGRYELIVTNSSGCTSTMEYLVKVKKHYEVYLPNAFSPNNDGTNDTWTLFVGDEVASVEKLSIFNRWGALVYQSEKHSPNEVGNGWDGTFRGKAAQSGTYIVSAEITFKDGDKQLFNGDINLLR